VTTTQSVQNARAGASSSTQRRLGWLAVAFVVLAFSMGSTLVKRANTPAVTVAFWRMSATAVIWNLLLALRGRRVHFADVKQACIPGVFFGFNLVTFYSGATHNSIANTELIAALTPFLVVPIGARLFGERLNPRALLFGLLAIAGVTLVLFSAPTKGDASLLGNVLGVAALMLWTGYIVSTRWSRKNMDVVTFMAAITPVSLVAVAPLAFSRGGLGSVSANGLFYIGLLTFVTGLGAHGLMVYAQKTIGIGTIGIAQVAQPALAALWSFLLVGESLHGLQIVGMVMVLGGILAFILVNQRSGS
jgi:drug/metabolite transporter (DMT)-like permease